MTAGLNLVCNICVYTFSDDEVGGALPSGTVAYENIPIRIENARNSLTLNIQGYETTKFLSAVAMYKPGMEINERKNYVHVVSPPNTEHYNRKFRIVSYQVSNLHPSDPRKFLLLNLERSDIPHGEEYQ